MKARLFTLFILAITGTLALFVFREAQPTAAQSCRASPWSDIPVAECNALIALYNSTNGANWKDSEGWPPSDTFAVCFLSNVVCNGDRTHVRYLHLSSNQLDGTIPSALSNLTHLEGLYLDDNPQLRGSIPPELGNLANLTTLWLFNNQLSGNIPPELGNLANLTTLWLFNNQLSGNIPPELGNLANLTSLLLDNNQLSGRVPPELGNLANLTSLLLDNNPLRCPLPTSLMNLINLERFGFDNTNLCVPDDQAFFDWLDGIPLMSTDWWLYICDDLTIDSVILEQQDVSSGNWEPLPSSDIYPTTIDGNTVRITANIKNTNTTDEAGWVYFINAGTDEPLAFVYEDRFPAGQTTKVVYDKWDTSGYAWNDNGSFNLKVALLSPDKTEELDNEPVTVEVYPKPVILVHGLWSDYSAWEEYQSFLTEKHPNWKAFAVGDGQAPGAMYTGEYIGNPFPINSIHNNALVLAGYIIGVREQLNAWHVDIVAHSMGGLISRKYIQNFMPDTPDDRPVVVSHLVMLGTPHLGSPCAELVAVPSLRELRPDYLTNEFNVKVWNRRNVPFSTFASNHWPSTCQSEENGDMVVPISSALDAITDRDVGSVNHIRMTGNTSIFSDFVLSRLALGPADYARGAAIQEESVTNFLKTTSSTSDPQLLLSESIEAPASTIVEIEIEVPAASVFGVTVSGPPSVGSTLLDPVDATAGSIAANSPEANELFRSFRAENPTSGTWKVQLDNQGSEAATVLLAGWLDGNPIFLDLEVGEPDDNKRVLLTATLTDNGSPVTGATVTAELKGTDGSVASVTPVDDGLHGDGQASDGVYSVTTDPLSIAGHVILVRADGPGFTRLTTGSVEVTDKAQSMIYLPIIIK